MDCVPSLVNITNDIHPRLDWSRVNGDDIYKYKCNTDTLLQEVTIPSDTLTCRNVNCTDLNHRDNLETLYNTIVDKLGLAGRDMLKAHNHGGRARPGWNDYAADLHQSARECFLLWRDLGKPKHGHIFDLMVRSRARFKYAMKNIKRRQDSLRRDAIANKFLNYSPDKFWKEIRLLNCSKTSLPCSVDGVSGKDNIVCMWKIIFATHFIACAVTEISRVLMWNFQLTCWLNVMILNVLL